MKIYMKINGINCIHKLNQYAHRNINYIVHVAVHNSSPLQSTVPPCDDTIVG